MNIFSKIQQKSLSITSYAHFSYDRGLPGYDAPVAKSRIGISLSKGVWIDFNFGAGWETVKKYDWSEIKGFDFIQENASAGLRKALKIKCFLYTTSGDITFTNSQYDNLQVGYGAKISNDLAFAVRSRIKKCKKWLAKNQL